MTARPSPASPVGRPPVTSPLSRWVAAIPWLLALIAFMSVILTLDAAQDCSWSSEGPGVTFDEGFNVEMGVYLVESSLATGLGMLHPATQYEIAHDPRYNPDHPPLGRWVLGLANGILNRLAPQNDRLYVLTFARCGSALAYALTVLLLSRTALAWWGTAGSLGSGLSLLLTPRLFGHAHLASLETAMNLTFIAVVLVLAQRWSGKESLSWRDGLWPGLLLGLALLTKMQAIFLLPAIAVWGLWNWRLRAIVPGLVLGVVAVLVFLLGWPWLWDAPLERSLQYFSRSTERITLYCYYLGERYADKEVPWHYPWVMFATTTPMLFLMLGGWGAVRQFRSSLVDSRRSRLLLWCWLVPLIAFSVPGVAVYDGERLFLVCWPVWSLFVGAGCWDIGRHLRPVASSAGGSSSGRLRPVLLGSALMAGLLSPLWSLIQLHPCQLSYYSELVGGLRGAVALGFEPTYWGDAVTGDMILSAAGRLPQGSRVAVAPLLHPATLTFLKRDSAFRLRPDIELEAYDDQRPGGSRNVLVIRRHADPWKSLSPPPEGTKVLSQESRSGAPLAEILELPN